MGWPWSAVPLSRATATIPYMSSSWLDTAWLKQTNQTRGKTLNSSLNAFQ